MSALKTKPLKNEPDKELLAISGSTMQYRIDIDNFIKRALEMENGKPNRKAKRKIAKKIRKGSS